MTRYLLSFLLLFVFANSSLKAEGPSASTLFCYSGAFSNQEFYFSYDANKSHLASVSFKGGTFFAFPFEEIGMEKRASGSVSFKVPTSSCLFSYSDKSFQCQSEEVIELHVRGSASIHPNVPTKTILSDGITLFFDNKKNKARLNFSFKGKDLSSEVVFIKSCDNY